MNASGVKGAICIGEPLRNQDFSLNVLGQKIKSAWDLELFSTYASTEMSTAFTECTEKQMIKYKGTTLYPPAMHNALNDFREVGGFVIEIYHNDIGTDEIKLKIAPSTEKPAGGSIQKIKDHFRSKLRVTPDIEFVAKAEIQELQMSKLGRKPVSVIDRRS